MSRLDRFMVHDVTLTEPQQSTTSYGDTVPDWSLPPAATFAEKGWFVRTATDENADGREAITDNWELTVAATSALTATMRIEHEGELYEIRGSIQRAATPTGTHHLVANLRRVAG